MKGRGVEKMEGRGRGGKGGGEGEGKRGSGEKRQVCLNK